ncbi:hypothetical protein SODALDRAFT_347367 [Sodiomyces alkalinus F11]|uniref:Uncharacterized protein n=1 Tax=Sodiomyces alkalinus (strain CBS 110278 / VKM F-3762 / F11) TaxID=1314773 RepID=A0A3N2Q6W6_SODAK|nr:hypothetical protein SODALDRAFT_347367 [Sodiomyces alkalinus F11]ROT42355.1 hypothetical protein SODALDRAFT_347367 [Sodiomyces alkalinus F11]
MAQETVPIPEPKALPLLGEIVRLRFPARTIVLVSTQALVDKTCDEKRFRKAINATLAARYGPDHPIIVTDDFTRLTLDTIALCSMGFRFNSFYSPVLHRFIEAIADFLAESGERARRMPLSPVFYSDFQLASSAGQTTG